MMYQMLNYYIAYKIDFLLRKERLINRMLQKISQLQEIKI